MIAPVLQTAVYVLSPAHDQVLLIHRNKELDDIHYGKYLSLGGHVEPGEDVLTGARREVFEESRARGDRPHAPWHCHVDGLRGQTA